MGEYNSTTVLTAPRIKKVTFSPEWKDGQAASAATDEEAERSPRIVKYIRLESYEDALDSIRFEPIQWPVALDRIRGTPAQVYVDLGNKEQRNPMLNPAGLTSPFTYELRAHVNGEKHERMVDLPETFNYLLGLNVRQRQAYEDGGRRYLVYRGETREAPGHRVAVIWRDNRGLDRWRLRQRTGTLLHEHNLTGDADTVYVNGNSTISGTKAVEPMFKARMFAHVNA